MCHTEVLRGSAPQPQSIETGLPASADTRNKVIVGKLRRMVPDDVSKLSNAEVRRMLARVRDIISEGTQE